MITIVKYCSNYKSIWDDFVACAKNGLFLLQRDFMDYHADRFEDSSLLFYDDEQLIAVLPLNINGQNVYSHGGLTFGGFIYNETMKQSKMIECFESLKSFLQKNNIKTLIYKAIPYIFHACPAQEDLYALFLQQAKLTIRSVSTAIDFAHPIKMPKGRKAQISRAKREGVQIIESVDFESFIELENQVLEKRHNTKAVHTAKELELLKSKFPEQIRLFFAMQGQTLLAANLLFEYKNVVHTQYMASNDLGRNIGALDLLIAEQLNQYKDSKKYFNFGISTEENGTVLNEGLIRQKEGFGGRSVCYDIYEWSI